MTFTRFCFLILLLAPNLNAATNRIIGGQDSFAGEYPFVAAIYKSTLDGIFFCVGSLYNQWWIITAGQCVDGAIVFNIRIGANNLNSNDSVRLSTDYYVIHPDYDPVTLENDIGLIKLRMPLSYTFYIKPFDYLPLVDVEPYAEATALGWGQIGDDIPGLADNLQKVSLTILSNAECNAVYGNQIADTMVCAEGSYNQGFCNGDTGGPLIERMGVGNTYTVLVGIASFLSSNGCESTDPSGYTRTYLFRQWIINITDNH